MHFCIIRYRIHAETAFNMPIIVCNFCYSSMYGKGGHYMTIYGYDGTDVYFDDPNSWNEKHEAKDFVNKHVAKGIWVF